MNIDEISDRLTITDVLLRLGRGVDRNDVDVVEGSFHFDATLSLGYYVGDLVGYLARFRAMADAPQPSLSGVQHRIGNISIKVRGDAAATESYYDVCWRRALESGEEVDELAAARALDRFERRDGRWAIMARTLIWDWAISLKASPLPWANSVTHVMGRRDSDDPSVRFWQIFEDQHRKVTRLL